MKRLLILPALLLLSSPVLAKKTTFDWFGTVKEPAWKVALGEKIRGTFEIDDEGPIEPDFSNETQKSYYALKVTMQAGGKTFKTLGETNGHESWDVNVSNYGLSAGNHLLIDAEDRNVASFDFFAQTRYGSLDLMAANNLDKIFLYGGFGVSLSGLDVPYNEDGGVFADFAGDIYSVTRRDDFVDAAPTPEPASIALMGSALAGFGGFRFFRRRKKLIS